MVRVTANIPKAPSRMTELFIHRSGSMPLALSYATSVVDIIPLGNSKACCLSFIEQKRYMCLQIMTIAIVVLWKSCAEHAPIA
jgi:hypothetical protein